MSKKQHKCVKGHECKGRCIPRTSICKNNIDSGLISTFQNAVSSIKAGQKPPEAIEQISEGSFGTVWAMSDGTVTKVAQDNGDIESHEAPAQTRAHAFGLAPKVISHGTDHINMERVGGVKILSSSTSLPQEEVNEFLDKLRKFHKEGNFHGDIHNGNLVNTNDGLRLIDYGNSKIDQDVDSTRFKGELKMELMRLSGVLSYGNMLRYPKLNGVLGDIDPDLEPFEMLMEGITISDKSLQEWLSD